MKVLFDITLACRFPHATHHGGGDFTKRHLLDMLEYPKAQGNLEVFSLKRAVLDEDVKSAIAVHRVPHHVLDSIQQLPAVTTSRKIDRIYSASDSTFLGLEKLPCRSLLTIHGLRMLEKPSDRYEWHMDRRVRQRLQWLAKILFPRMYRRLRLRNTADILEMKGDLFVAVDSRHSKYAIANFYPWFDQKRVCILYPPPLNRSGLIQSDCAALPELESTPFFLIVSSNRWVKNTWRTVQALDRMFSAFPQLPHQVALAGTMDSFSLGQLKNPERFHQLGYLSEAVLESLYKKAFCLLYLSLNEGFGYPPLDAMKYGTPVIAAADSSIGEVCGSAALYANPYDENEMINRFLQVCFEPEMVLELREAGKQRYEQVCRQQMLDQQALFQGLFGDDSAWVTAFQRAK